MKRLLRIDAHIVSEIDFGFGILGRIEKGGTFQIRREQVSENRWKTSLVDVHVSGHIILFKNISKDQHEVRSTFQPMSPHTSVQDAITPRGRHVFDQDVTAERAGIRTNAPDVKIMHVEHAFDGTHRF